MEMAAEKVVLFFLAAVGVSLLAVILALVVVILASVVPWTATWIPRFRKRDEGSLKPSSPEPGELQREGSANRREVVGTDHAEKNPRERRKVYESLRQDL